MENNWKPSKTIYQIIKEFINEKYIDTDTQSVIITRQELMRAIEATGEYILLIEPYRKISKVKIFSESTVDTIRNQLEKCGYLSKCYDQTTGKLILGKYKIEKQIPEDLSGSELRKHYNQSF